MRGRALVATLSVAALPAWLVIGCSGSLPTPPEVPHPERAYVEVPYPPPAALVEEVPEPAPPDTVWVDGHWIWRGRYYVWQRGGWVKPPPGAAYATWRSRLVDDGRLLFAPGAWYDAAGQDLVPPEVELRARTPPSQTTPETEAPR
jgi:hypothetical protein